MSTMINVHRSGRIEFSDKWEPDAICLGIASREQLERAKARARLAYDGVTYLVPGIAEAETEEAALQALQKWSRWVMDNKVPA